MPDAVLHCTAAIEVILYHAIPPLTDASLASFSPAHHGYAPECGVHDRLSGFKSACPAIFAWALLTERESLGYSDGNIRHAP